MADYRESPYLVEVFDYDILHLELNTPVYILVLVLVVMFFLHRWLFAPVLRTLDARSTRRDQLAAQRQAHLEETASLQAAYRRSQHEAREATHALRQRERQDAETAANERLSNARHQAQRTLTEVRQQIAKESTAAQRTLEAQRTELAERIVARVLAPPGAPPA